MLISNHSRLINKKNFTICLREPNKLKIEGSFLYLKKMTIFVLLLIDPLLILVNKLY
jgi:hypothetical protein